MIGCLPLSRALKRGLHVSTLLAMGVLGASLSPALNGESEKVPRFESDILPIFQANCLVCHGENLQQNGLDLRTRDGALKGGESGPAILPGSARESLLFEKIYSGSMPIGGEKLIAQEIELIRHWIDAGGLKEGEEPESAKKQRKADEVTEREVMATILGAKCLPCHGRRRQYSDLDLRTREGLLRGGKSGPAIVPGRPDESLLVRRIVAQEMPPPELQEQFSVRGLTSEELEKLRE